MKELFPLNTFQQDAVLKRLEELREINEDIVDGSEHLFENITDSQGHKRFIEGDLELQEITGITKTYGKWSLSGSHLMIVLCVVVAETSAITSDTYLVDDINIPQWIKDKIVNISTNLTMGGSVAFYGVDWSQQSATIALAKESSKLRIRCLNNVTFTKDRTARISYDLLIDNEEPVTP